MSMNNECVDLQFAAYACSDPFCEFTSHSLSAVNGHISKNHFGSINKVIVQNNITKDTEEKAEVGHCIVK